MRKMQPSSGSRRSASHCRCTLLALIILLGAGAQRARCDEAKPGPKPRVAVFPIAGDADEIARERCGRSLRLKLDREGTYEIVDGPRMKELVEAEEKPVGLETPEETVRKLGGEVEAAVLIWGELAGKNQTLRVKILDLRGKEPKARTIETAIADPTDLRFVSEQILQTLPGIKPFEHPNDEAVQADAQSEALWKNNPNLVPNSDFSKQGGWTALYQAEKYSVALADKLPEENKVSLLRLDNEPGGPNYVLAMNLSRFCAENNGLACLSDPISIAPDTRYRLSFRYRSEGPMVRVFVKGYTEEKDIKGEKTQREIYRRQVPLKGPTDGKWVTIVDDLNPQHVRFPVQTLRVDLYTYYNPGVIMFDDVILKAVGKQTRQAKDKAIDEPVTRQSEPETQPVRPR